MEGTSIIGQFQKEVFTQFFGTKTDNYHQFDEVTSKAKPTHPPNDLAVLLNSQAPLVLRAHVHAHGVVYSWVTTHMGNSLITFAPNGNFQRGDLHFGSIKYIFVRGGQVQLAVHWQITAQMDNNPFSCYPLFPAQVISSQLHKTLEIVEVDWILSHYTRYQFTNRLSVAVILLQVRISNTG